MDGIKTYLKNISIENFLSLHNVILPLKPLTVLVGPNASGKSNILNALVLLMNMMETEDPPPSHIIKDRIWAGGAETVKIGIEADIHGNRVSYCIELKPDERQRIAHENLKVNDIEVISVKDGKGRVRDENDSNPVDYKSNKIALKSAGDYGNKPITNNIREFIRNWSFYDIDPLQIRNWKNIIQLGSFIGGPTITERLDSKGVNLCGLLSDWYENAKDQFQSVNNVLSKGFKANIKLDAEEKDKEEGYELVLLEGDLNSIPMEKGSDGTLRLIAYQALKNQADLPSLIAIEEPEQNFHPAWLKILNNILIQLSKKTQVIITTHSSQLLDTFSADDLNNNLNVLLLRNVPGIGTEVISLDEIQQKRESLKSWIKEFGIGSAIFDSELLQDLEV